ncbi:MAG: YjbQ family protein [SAR324 cluster bacterium]|nr:YjbQ family protein [SAR324 cluster bacterium]
MPYQKTLKFLTKGKQFINITHEIQNIVKESGIGTGLCCLFIKHTSASLLIQENADPDVLRDLEFFMSRMIKPHEQGFRHTTEGQDDMPAHIRSALTHTSEQIPVTQGRLNMGIWQGIYLWEHRDHGSTREVVVHILG